MADFDKLQQLLDQIEEERAKGRMQRRALTAAILAIFLLFIGNLYFKVTNFDTDTFVVHLQEHATASVWPVYSTQLKSLADEAVPAMSNAMAAEAGALLPKLSERLHAEAGVFQENMAKHLKAALDAKFSSAMTAHEGELKATFPEFAKDEQAYTELMEHLQSAARLWAQGQLDTTFQRHIALLQSINESVQRLQTEAAADRVKTGDREMEDVLFMMGEIFNARVSEE
jgi:hypothetical protein